MKRTSALPLAIVFALGVPGGSNTAAPRPPDPVFVSRTATVDGSKIFYRTGGTGPALILLHGYAQTSRMWNRIMPLLAKRFTLIVPDLPGIGQSDIPASGLDMMTAARRIHTLARSLGVSNASVVGHDIGLMVAYAYAAQFPSETTKLVEMDAFLPGVGNWAEIYNSPALWHFRFHGASPEALVKGRERIYFDYYWDEFAADSTRSISVPDRAAYVAEYSRPGRMRAGWAYFEAFPQTAREFARISKTPLTMPVLVIGGDKSNGVALGQQLKLVATNVKVVLLRNTGHWLIDERPRETTDALVRFL
jgi:pimeloyl-ACP methyl ester carboxylesterase